MAAPCACMAQIRSITISNTRSIYILLKKKKTRSIYIENLFQWIKEYYDWIDF